jgi:hypothetical protein
VKPGDTRGFTSQSGAGGRQSPCFGQQDRLLALAVGRIGQWCYQKAVGGTSGSAGEAGHEQSRGCMAAEQRRGMFI